MCQNCNQNNCNECTQEVHICNQCSPEPCDCPIVDLSTDCVNYDQDDIMYGANIVVPKNTILSVALDNIVQFLKIKIEEIQNYFKLVNTGTGANIYSGVNLLGEKKLRKLKSSNGSVTITEGTDDINFSVAVGDGSDTKINGGTNVTVTGNGTIATPYNISSLNSTYSATNVGAGAAVYKDSTPIGANIQLNLRKINTSNSGDGEAILKTQVENTNDISIISKTLKSTSLNITSTADEISIETPTLSIGALKTFYINNAYVPTVDSPSDGSIIRPYLTYDQAKTAFIGTGDITTPQYTGSKIVMQTSSSTASNPTVNELILEFEDSSTLVYTGTDLYMFDTEILYPLIPKNTPRQDLTKGIKISLTGVGQITRTAGIGLVRGMGSNRVGLAEFGDYFSEVFLGLKSSDEIFLIERVSYPNNIWDGDTTNYLGITYESIYGKPFKYSLQLTPTVPLIYSRYNNLNSPVARGVNSYGTLGIENLANTAIKVEGTDTLFGANIINFNTNTQYIATPSATKMVDFTSVYSPVTNKNYYEGESHLFCNKITAGTKDNLAITGVDNFFKFTNNATFLYGVLDINSNYFTNKFININDVSNTISTFYIANNLKGSIVNLPSRYLIDTNQLSITILMPNSQISPMLNKSTTVVDIIPDTKGTLSTFFDKPIISGINDYVDDATAIAAGLITNALYYNTTTGGLKTV